MGTHWRSSHYAVTLVRNKYSNIQGRSPNVVSDLHTISNCSYLFNRGGNSPRFSIRKIFQLNPELGQKCSEITNKMFKRTKHP